MKSIILYLLLAFGALSNVAMALPNPLEQAQINRQIEGEKTVTERRLEGIFPLIESTIGCAGTQSVRNFSIFGLPLFHGEWECITVDNMFNSGAALPMNGGNDLNYEFIYKFTGAIIAILFIVIILKLSSGHKHSKSQKKGMAFSFVFFVVILSVACIPYYKNDKGENAYSLAVIGYLAFTAFALEGANQFLTGNAELNQTDYPFITIPANKGQKTNDVVELMQHLLCRADNINSGASRAGTFKLMRDFDTYSIFSQYGDCAFDMNMNLNMETVRLEAKVGLPKTYTAFTDKKVGEIFTKLVKDSNNVVDHVLSSRGRTPKEEPESFIAENFTCANKLDYPVDKLSYYGMTDYLYASAECIQNDMVQGFSRYPNISEDFYGTVLKGRLVHLCEQNTYTNAVAGGSVSDQDMDTTPSLRKPGDSLDSIQAKAAACVTSMCSDASSPYVCSASINYYAMTAGNRHLTNPSIITLPAYFISQEIQSSKFADDGQSLLNSLTMTSSTATSLLDSSTELNMTTVASIPFTVGVRNTGIARAQDIIQPQVLAISTATQMLQSLKDWGQIGDDGYFGEKYTTECMSYPNQISPNKYNCGSVFQTIHLQGERWLAAGVELKIMAALSNSRRKSAVEKAEETAVIGAVKTGLQNVSIAGTASIIAKIVGAKALDSSVQNSYSEYGNHLTPVAMAGLAVAMAVPEFASFISSVGSTLQAMGAFAAYAPQLIVVMTNLGVMLSVLVGFVYFTYTFMLYFIILLSNNNGVNPTTDWFKPLDEFTRTFFAILMYPVVFTICIAFISAIFMFQLFDVTSMIQISNGIDSDLGNFSSIANVLALQFIKMALPIFLIGSILKVARNTPNIINGHIFGNVKDWNEADDDYSIALKKLNL